MIPQFRARRSGVVVNVTSTVTLTAMPLAAAYTASKTAIQGFTASLAHELQAFNVRVKLVEPGYAPTTRFAHNTTMRVEDLIPQAYAEFAAPIFAQFADPPLVTTEADVAEAVWQAANDQSGQPISRPAPTPWRSPRQADRAFRCGPRQHAARKVLSDQPGASVRLRLVSHAGCRAETLDEIEQAGRLA